MCYCTALQDKDVEKLKSYGDVEGVAKLLQSDCTAGLLKDVDAIRTDIFGPNTLPITPPVGLFTIMWDTLHDPILILLLVAAAVSALSARYLAAQSKAQHAVMKGFNLDL